MQPGSGSHGLLKVRCARLDRQDQTVQLLVGTLLISRQARSNHDPLREVAVTAAPLAGAR